MDNEYDFNGYRTKIDDEAYIQKMQKYLGHWLAESYNAIFKYLKEQLKPTCSLDFIVDQALVEKAVTDAAIELRRICQILLVNRIPSLHKIAACLSYWWLRYKPVSINHPDGCRINSDELLPILLENLDNEEAVYKIQIFSWRLQHINELVAAYFAITFIHQLDSLLNEKEKANKLKCNESKKGCTLADSEQMKVEDMKNLVNSFAYFDLRPETIELILEIMSGYYY